MRNEFIAVHFDSVHVTIDEVTLQGGSFAGGVLWYQGYTTSYQNGIFSVTILASSLRLTGLQDDPGTISIPNTFGEIKEVDLIVKDTTTKQVSNDLAI